MKIQGKCKLPPTNSRPPDSSPDADPLRTVTYLASALVQDLLDAMVSMPFLYLPPRQLHGAG
eukprot:13952739-Alexandrium_andersonii.AAC.1